MCYKVSMYDSFLILKIFSRAHYKFLFLFMYQQARNAKRMKYMTSVVEAFAQKMHVMLTPMVQSASPIAAENMLIVAVLKEHVEIKRENASINVCTRKLI